MESVGAMMNGEQGKAQRKNRKERKGERKGRKKKVQVQQHSHDTLQCDLVR